jgi:hypothetical protein
VQLLPGIAQQAAMRRVGWPVSGAPEALTATKTAPKAL